MRLIIYFIYAQVASCIHFFPNFPGAMGVLKRGINKHKGHGKGAIWNSSRRSLHLAYTYNESRPLLTLTSLRLHSAPRNMPCFEVANNDVNLYYYPKELPARNLRLHSSNTSSKDFVAFEAALNELEKSLRKSEKYLLRRMEGASITYTYVEKPAAKEAFKYIHTVHTFQGKWRFFVMDFDEAHVDCRRISPRCFKNLKDLKGQNVEANALRYALTRGMTE